MTVLTQMLETSSSSGDGAARAVGPLQLVRGLVAHYASRLAEYLLYTSYIYSFTFYVVRYTLSTPAQFTQAVLNGLRGTASAS